ncbi:hypothetical protein BDB01DRAFT_831794 [Pilobolus umbonatus]|nr:hypothetical protein BDB01DRAFT_831794 [Pilobolus umbonatus]
MHIKECTLPRALHLSALSAKVTYFGVIPFEMIFLVAAIRMATPENIPSIYTNTSPLIHVPSPKLKHILLSTVTLIHIGISSAVMLHDFLFDKCLDRPPRSYFSYFPCHSWPYCILPRHLLLLCPISGQMNTPRIILNYPNANVATYLFFVIAMKGDNQDAFKSPSITPRHHTTSSSGVSPTRHSYKDKGKATTPTHPYHYKRRYVSSPLTSPSRPMITNKLQRLDTFSSDIGDDPARNRWTRHDWRKLEDYYVRKNRDCERAANAFYNLENWVPISPGLNGQERVKELWTKEEILWRCKCLDTSVKAHGGLLPSERSKKRKPRPDTDISIPHKSPTTPNKKVGHDN